MKYVELHCKTNYSFLEGASHPDEYVERAVELGYDGLAITDRNSLAGVVRAFAAARHTELNLLIGAEITLNDAPPMVVWATDRAAYGRLCRLLTLGRRQAPKGDFQLGFEQFASYAKGLIAGFVPPPRFFAEPLRAAQAGSAFKRALQGESLRLHTTPGWGHPPSSEQAMWLDWRWQLGRFRELFGDRGYVLAELNWGADDQGQLQQLLKLSRQTQVPLVAAGDVHYHVAQRMPLHDVLTAIRHGTTVANAGHWLLPNSQRHLLCLETRQRQFAAQPELLERTCEIASQCRFSLEELRYEYPEELAPDGTPSMEFLRQLTWRGAQKRYPEGVPEKVVRQLEHELELIEELQYEAYFLTVWDLVRFARSQKILCQGRGSAANSAVCYCLGVTSVDPDATDLLFERFISRERNEAPDIDVDFEHERREEVLQYLYQKYGRERAGLAATVITYRSRSAVRDVGKALGLSLDRVDALAKQVEGYAHEPKLAERCQAVGIDPETRVGRQLIWLVNELVGFPRHLSQHVGGMVMTRGPLCELVPIENAAMPERTVIQWDKDDLEELGILKVDCLCLGMLSAIRRCFAMIDQHHHRPLTLATIPPEDPAVYDMIGEADTMGVFQIESRAQMSMLPRLRPRCYYDLVIEVAIVRPGPIQGQMVHPYLRRRAGEEQVEYPNEAIRGVLQKTLGVPIFQEQAMRLAVVAAGFTPGEADQLRRAMGAWRKTGVIDKFRQKLLAGMKAKGLSEQFADQVFRQIRGFGEYGFPESHAASFALLVYVSAWLKHYYPGEFCAAIINSQPMGFYAPAQLIRDAQSHGVKVLPVDINHSDWDCTMEMDGAVETDAASSLALRMGLRLINGLREDIAHKMMAIRQTGGRFLSLSDFSKRTRLGQATISLLSDADAFGSLQRDRRSALWESLAQEKLRLEQPLFASLEEADDPLPPALPRLDAEEEVLADYRSVGLSLKAHPISFHRAELDQLRVTSSAGLASTKDGRHVRVAGLVILRQRPSTAKGITFVTIEDETGTANLVVKQHIWERYYAIARRSPAWIAHGKLERRQGVIHVVVNRIDDFSTRLKSLNAKSRDFR